MAENQTVESFDTARIRRESGPVTSQAVDSIWKLLNEINGRLIRSVRRAQNVDSPAAMALAPTAQQDNLDADGVGVLLFTGSTNFTITGIRNGEDGRRVLLHNAGTATITLAHASASSDVTNRFHNEGAVNATLAQDQTITVVYLAGRWRIT